MTTHRGRLPAPNAKETIMFRRNLLSRLLALGASVAITFSVVAMLAGYALPAVEGGPMLVRPAAPLPPAQAAGESLSASDVKASA